MVGDLEARLVGLVLPRNFSANILVLKVQRIEEDGLITQDLVHPIWEAISEAATVPVNSHSQR